MQIPIETHLRSLGYPMAAGYSDRRRGRRHCGLLGGRRSRERRWPRGWSWASARPSPSSDVCKLVREWFPPSRISTLARIHQHGRHGRRLHRRASGLAGGPMQAGASRSAASAWSSWSLPPSSSFIVRDRIGAIAHTPPEEGGAGWPWAGKFAGLLKNPQVWLNAIYATCISLVFVAFGGLCRAATTSRRPIISTPRPPLLSARCSSLAVSSAASSSAGGRIFFAVTQIAHARRRRRRPRGHGRHALCPRPAPVGISSRPLRCRASSAAPTLSPTPWPTICSPSWQDFPSDSSAPATTPAAPRSAAPRRHAPPTKIPRSSLSTLTAADYGYAFTPLVIFMAVGLVAVLLMKETMEREKNRATA